jgi:hypothetical protein
VPTKIPATMPSAIKMSFAGVIGQTSWRGAAARIECCHA